jgi:hypothetical protein
MKGSDSRQPDVTHRVNVIDPSSHICAKALRKVKGVVACWVMDDKIAPLAKPPYFRHQDSTHKYNGRKLYGFLRLESHAVFLDRYDANIIERE